MAKKTVSLSAGAQNTYSDAVELHGYFNLSLSGTWVATVTVERSFDSGVSWLEVDTFTSNCQKYGVESERGVQYRVGVATGDYTSGTVVGRLSQ